MSIFVDSDDVGREQHMSYLRTTIREVRWLLVCGPLLGGLVLNACLSDNASTDTGDDPAPVGRGW